MPLINTASMVTVIQCFTQSFSVLLFFGDEWNKCGFQISVSFLHAIRRTRLHLSLAISPVLRCTPDFSPAGPSFLPGSFFHPPSPCGFSLSHSSLPSRLSLHRHHAVIIPLLSEHVADPNPSSPSAFITDLVYAYYLRNCVVSDVLRPPESCPIIQTLRRLQLPLFQSLLCLLFVYSFSLLCIFEHSVSAPLSTSQLVLFCMCSYLDETRTMSSAKSRSSSLLVKFHLMPFLCLSVVLCIVQSTISRKRKPDKTHPCLMPVVI